MTRQEEIRALLKLSISQLKKRAGERLVICRDIDALHRHFAESIAAEITANNQQQRPTRLILPVGPVGQYPILADLVNDQAIHLKRCWFFMMDEHCDENGVVLPADHPLSFRRTFHELFTSRVKRNRRLPARQLIFPDHVNVH